MSSLQLRGALQSLDLDIPLQSLVVVSSPDGEAAFRLAFGLIAAEAQRRMAPLLAPTWLPAVHRLASAEVGEVEGLRPTFVFRHRDAVWPLDSRIGQVLGVFPVLAAGLLEPSVEQCEACAGAGRRASVLAASLVGDPTRSLSEGVITLWAKKNSKFYAGVLESLASQVGLDLDAPWKQLSKPMQDAVLFGSPGSNYKGVVYDVERRLANVGEARGIESLGSLTPYLEWLECQECQGTGLGPAARTTKVLGTSWSQLYGMTGRALLASAEKTRIGRTPNDFARLRRQLASRLEVMEAFGLAGASLGCRASDLSEQQARQLRLAEICGSGLQQALYVLEDPFAVLEPSVHARVLNFMRSRVTAGHSLMIATADSSLSAVSDWHVELGNGAEPGSVTLVHSGLPDSAR